MWISREDSAVRVWTPAKVNLFLEVQRRRPDGYHDLATLMVTVGLYDTLEMRPRDDSEVRLRCAHPGLSTGADNLICRAAQLLRQRQGLRQGVDIQLIKRIPMAAGLAGGSSDAAATLAGLNRMWQLGLEVKELSSLGAELGSDVAFFFHGPAAWCTGRGEIVEPIHLGRPLHLVLCTPPVGLSTAQVFQALQVPSVPRSGVEVREAAEKGNIPDLGRNLFNRLEEPAMRLCSEVGKWRERLAQQACLGVLMSGSGSTVLALARDEADAWRVARALNSASEAGEQARVHVVRSCD